MNNYAFCVDWVVRMGSGRPIRVLDYGCGAGEIVNALRDRGFEAFGCDPFAEADATREKAVRPGYLGEVVRVMEGKAIPFARDSFDFVVTNQVLEHVRDLDAVLAEIQKVLKPGGSLLGLFPDKGVLKEPHCGIPFLHWFAKGSRARYWYAFAMRSLGMGFHKSQRTRSFWSRHFCDYLDNQTFYRTHVDIETAFNRHFCDLEHHEGLFFSKRFDGMPTLARLPAWVGEWAVRRHCGEVITVRKPLPA